VFTPKYHRKIIYGKLREDIGKILRELCERKDIEIIEAHAMPDHIHMLVSIPPNERVSSFMGYLKGKSTMMIYERYANLKYKYGNRHFWSRGYYVSTVGGNKQAVQKYIQNQEKEDLISDQISMVEYYDPFGEWLKSNSRDTKKKK
jgi:putative transposase